MDDDRRKLEALRLSVKRLALATDDQWIGKHIIASEKEDEGWEELCAKIEAWIREFR